MTVLIFNNVRLIFHRLALVVIVITTLVTSVAMACSVWNEGKSCNCECEDISIGCRATCHNMCIVGCHGTLEIINQKHCYDKCHADFQDCFNSCYWNTFCTVGLSTHTHTHTLRKVCLYLYCIVKRLEKIVVVMCCRAAYFQKIVTIKLSILILRNYPHAQHLFKSWSFMFDGIELKN